MTAGATRVGANNMPIENNAKRPVVMGMKRPGKYYKAFQRFLPNTNGLVKKS